MPDKEENKINPMLGRFIKYLETKDIALRKAEELMKLGNGRFGKMKANSTEIKGSLMENILHSFPDLNSDWLKSGNGEMLLRKVKPRTEARVISQFPNIEESALNDKYLYAPDGSIGMKVMIVPGKVQAGYLRGYPDPEYYEGFDHIIIPVDQHHKSDYLGFEVVGNSMVCLDSEELAEQSIFPGRIAVGRSLSKSQWSSKLHTHNYDSWVIAHKTEGILIKQIAKHDVEKGIIIIHSLNPEYQDEELHLDDIEQIFSVVQIVKKTR